MKIPYNKYLSERIEGLLLTLDAAHSGSKPLSSNSKGYEREWFVNNVLSLVFPPHIRFSSGEITDSDANISGQLDIIMEYPHRFSFSSYKDGPRLFMAESVAAVIEVKSNISAQWDQVRETAYKAALLKRKYSYQFWEELHNEIESGITSDGHRTPQASEPKNTHLEKIQLQMEAAKGKGEVSIPIYAVGYEGWSSEETIFNKLDQSNLKGILIIKERKFVTREATFRGAACLLNFLTALEADQSKSVLIQPSHMMYTVV